MGLSNSTRVQPSSDRPVEVQIIGSDFIDVLHARDISTTGVGLWVPHQFEGCDIQSDVELILTIPEQKSFMTRGSVRHRTNTEGREKVFGVEFTGLSKQHKRIIENYIEACLAEGLSARR